MTAREMFKGNRAPGKVLECSKGGYRDDTFAYRVCGGERCYIVDVISKFNPRSRYTVELVRKDGTAVKLEDVTSAILYSEYVGRTQAQLWK